MAVIEVKTKGFDKANADQEKLNKSGEKQGRIYHANAQEAQRSAAIQQRLIRDVETGQERYNRQLRQTQVALAGHAREVELLARMENKLQRELFETSQEYREGQRVALEMDAALKKASVAAEKREMDKAARMRRVMDEDARQAKRIADQQRSAEDRLYDAEVRLIGLKQRGMINERQYAREQKRLQDEYQKELGETAGKLGEVGESSASAFDVGRVAKWAASLAGPSALLAKTLSVMREMRQEQEALANKAAGESYDAGSLMQLAGADPAKAKELLGMADETFGEGFVRDRSEAYKLAYEIGSAGLEKDRKFLSRLSTIDDSAGMARSYGRMRAAFSGGDNIGSVEQLISKGIAAAGPATGVSPSQAIEAAVSASVPAQAFALKDEEVLAAVSMVSQKMSASEAGTAVGELLTQLQKGGYADRLKGKGLPAVIDQITSMNLDAEGLVRELGSKPAAQAYETLRNKSAFNARLQMVSGAQDTGLAEKSIDNALDQERIGAAVARRSGEATNVLSQDKYANARSLAEGEADRRSGGMRNAGAWGINNWLAGATDSTWRFFAGDEEMADKGRRRLGLPYDETPMDRVARHLEEQNRLTRELLGKTDTQTDAIKSNPASIPVR
jgi:hypothetical protein